MINLNGRSTARSSAFCLQLAVNDTLRIPSDISNLIKPNTKSLKG